MSSTITQPIERSTILHVYSGKAGRCCCGCSGKHTYREDPLLRELGELNRGYSIKDDECNERTITRVLNILNSNLRDVRNEGDLRVLEIGSRLYIAYLLPDDAVASLASDSLSIYNTQLRVAKHIRKVESALKSIEQNKLDELTDRAEDVCGKLEAIWNGTLHPWAAWRNAE